MNISAFMLFTKRLLFILLSTVGIFAVGGGVYGLSGARKVPIEWLNDSIFRSYMIPSLFLFVIVGGSSFVAAVSVVRQRKFAGFAATSAGLILITWIVVQVSVIGFVSWLQPLMFTVALLILFLTYISYRYAS